MNKKEIAVPILFLILSVALQWKENVEIVLKEHLKAGKYVLMLYDVAVSEQHINRCKRKIPVRIIND